ncbi:MAG TPA: hypothetical protein IAA66_09925 [Candidatus Avichristensenella intestinipullorum]|uniref:Uncharacterized protein n=1 Tax=Candidatus Avichristensenella intestinipullorum TaxID=2840693 RepID=A0A9D0YX66_9FIRM|nr:hypothetical protein [Candidatus Avichristensenella intestinipullorum]
MDILFMETIGINTGFPLLSWKGMGRISSEEKSKENQEKTKRKSKEYALPAPAAGDDESAKGLRPPRALPWVL